MSATRRGGVANRPGKDGDVLRPRRPSAPDQRCRGGRRETDIGGIDSGCSDGAGAKTGTAEVFGGQATSVFASFAPASDPKYVVVVMVPKSGEGADVSASMLYLRP